MTNEERTKVLAYLESLRTGVAVWKLGASWGLDECLAIMRKELEPISDAEKPTRMAFEHYWLKTRGGKKARRELERHPLQPQTYRFDSPNRHWITWQAALLEKAR